LGSFNGTSQTTALRWNASGQVGIGSASWTTGAATTARLVVQGDDASTPPLQLNIRGNSDTNKRLLVGYNTTANYGGLQAYSAASTTSNLLLNPAGGNVGIGTTTASAKLDVAGDIRASGISAAGDAGYIFNSGGDSDGGIFSPGDGTVTIKTDSVERVRINSSGRVGIGTVSPVVPLHVASTGFPNVFFDGSSTSGTWLNLRNTSAGGTNWLMLATGSTNGEGTGKLLFNNAGTNGPGNGGSNVMTLQPNGSVGIGTTNPTQAKLVVLGTAGTTSGSYFRFSWNSNGVPIGNFTSSITPTIFADGAIYAGASFTGSDARIKTISGRSDGKQDLLTLGSLEITDYTMLDVVARGSGKHKKVIAQQVEKVFPQAISKSTDVIPDIYRKAAMKDGWVKLATDLKKGERVRLIDEKKGAVHEVLEVNAEGFRTAFSSDSPEVFVYGREVDDFRSVDYEAISMLNVSATQQLKKELESEVKSLREENSELRTRLVALEAREKARDVRMSSIEKRLESSEEAGTRTISLKAD
jgi:hypothetical protein